MTKHTLKLLLLLLVSNPFITLKAETNLWQSIAQHSQIEFEMNTKVSKKLKWYKRQSFYNHQIKRNAEPYLPYIVSELSSRNMPLELALIPIIESEYTMAKSHKGAAGIWQLMPATATHYGVPINDYFDGRYDLNLSTQAALNYLSDLYQTFNHDWLLAIAAYNCGETKVKRAVFENKKKNKKTDFWSLTLPKETREYVPKILALSSALKQSKGDYFPVISDQASSRIVDIGQPFSILVIAELLKLPSSEILKYNPAYIADISAPSGPFHLRLPNQLALTLEQVLLFTRYGKENGYTVKKGDSLYKLAKLTNTRVSTLKSLNRLNSNIIKIGQTLILPASSKSMTSLVREYAISPYLIRQSPEMEQLEVNYTVKPQDSLWHIATLFDVAVNQLLDWNNMQSDTLIRPGDVIKVMITQPKSLQHEGRDYTKIVQQLPYYSMTQAVTLNN